MILPMEPDDMLEAMASTSNTAYTLYNEAHLTPNCLVCFFEGKFDKEYYGSRILNTCGQFIEIVCEGKSNVLAIYDRVHDSDKDRYRLAYFTDHDFDATNQNNNIFETDTYAIENFYCSQDAVQRVLTSYIGLDPVNDRDDYNRAFTFYQNQMNDFHAVVKLYNNYYAAVKLIERTAPYPEYHIKCGTAFPESLAEISIENKTAKDDYTLEGLNIRYGTSVSQAQLDAQDDIIGVDPARLYRGKYELEILKLIFTELISQTTKRSRVKKAQRIIQRTIPPLNVSKCIQSDKFMEDLTDYADTPAHLVTYLERFV